MISPPVSTLTTAMVGYPDSQATRRELKEDK